MDESDGRRHSQPRESRVTVACRLTPIRAAYNDRSDRWRERPHPTVVWQGTCGERDMANCPRRIVIATDFSPGSAAAERALATMWSLGSSTRVHLVHVVEPVAFSVPPPLWADYDSARLTDARGRMERVAKRLQIRLDAGPKVRPFVLTGTPYVEICRLAGEVGADLIIVGTHGRTGVRHVLLGSVAERVVRHAGRPVLAVPLRRVRAARRPGEARRRSRAR
jgi:nucleotide-binding universal stress UspA family protein